jgi:nitric oxide reductase NorD protein
MAIRRWRPDTAPSARCAQPQLSRIPQVQAAWQVLDCGFAAVADVFEECIYDALTSFSKPQLDAYLDAARHRQARPRAEPLLAFLEEWPTVVTSASGDQEPLLPQ